MEWGKEWVGRWAGGGRRVFYTLIMYLDCDLTLKKKLLPLVIELVVILNHLGVIHFWQPQKMTNFVTPHPIYRHVTKFITSHPMWTSHFHVDIINVWFLTCLLWYYFFSCFRKNFLPVFERNKPVIKILLKDMFLWINKLWMWIVSQNK